MLQLLRYKPNVIMCFLDLDGIEKHSNRYVIIVEDYLSNNANIIIKPMNYLGYILSSLIKRRSQITHRLLGS